jgi:hypothetical protein
VFCNGSPLAFTILTAGLLKLFVVLGHVWHGQLAVDQFVGFGMVSSSWMFLPMFSIYIQPWGKVVLACL